ncbi:MAG: 2-oxo acid dehydrogenase subunit E2, partial [archaeon]
MLFEFAFPDVGEGIAEGQVLKWLKKEGDTLKADEAVVEVETGKAVVEIPAPKGGKLLKQNFAEGQTVRVGEILFTIETEEEPAAQRHAAQKKQLPEKRPEPVAQPKQEAPQPKKRESFGVVGEIDEAQEVIVKQPEHRPRTQTAEQHGQVHALPATRKLAKDIGVDISKINGSGLNERVTSQDVVNAAREVHGEKEPHEVVQSGPKITVDKFGRVLEIPLTKVRSEIAKAMVKSMFSSPHAVAMEEADVTDLARLREKEKPVAEKKGVHLTFLPFIVKAVVGALKDHAYLNARFDEESQKIVVKQYYN